MKILVACEFSGRVRDAFIRKGHDAWSCDLLPTESPGPHIRGDVLKILDQEWDMMIAHPPCTFLSAAGLHFCKGNADRIQKRDEAVMFVKKLAEAPIDKIAIENPVGYLSTIWQRPTQVIYMNDFGHSEARKPTCLWLKNLPLLQATKTVPFEKGAGKRVSLWFSKTRDPHQRSITFQGVADAMSEQWGSK